PSVLLPPRYDELTLPAEGRMIKGAPEQDFSANSPLRGGLPPTPGVFKRARRNPDIVPVDQETNQRFFARFACLTARSRYALTTSLGRYAYFRISSSNSGL